MASRNLFALILALVSVNSKPFDEYCLVDEDFQNEAGEELLTVANNYLLTKKTLL